MLIGVSLSELHTSRTALCTCVCVCLSVCLVCWFACGHSYTVYFKVTQNNYSHVSGLVKATAQPECNLSDLKQRQLKLKHACELNRGLYSYGPSTAGCSQRCKLWMMVHRSSPCIASFPGSRAWAGRKDPGTHCLRMLSFPVKPAPLH